MAVANLFLVNKTSLSTLVIHTPRISRSDLVGKDWEREIVGEIRDNVKPMTISRANQDLRVNMGLL